MFLVLRLTAKMYLLFCFIFPPCSPSYVLFIMHITFYAELAKCRTIDKPYGLLIYGRTDRKHYIPRDLTLMHIRPQMQASCKRLDEGGSFSVRVVRASGWRASYLNEEEFG